MTLLDKLSSRVQKQFNKDKPGGSTSHQSSELTKELFRHDNQQLQQIPSEGSPDPKQVKIASVQELGDVRSNALMHRDLGFQGKLGPYTLLTYGDTMYTDEQDTDGFKGMTCNSAALACTDPTKVFDPLCDSAQHPECFLLPSKVDGEDPGEWSLGLTNVIETTPGEGILYFLLNHRPQGKDNPIGAGLAAVSLSDTDTSHPKPTIKRLHKYLWDATTEPWYGDVCSLKAGSHIYAYGHAKDSPFVFLSRAPLDHATELDAYEYWNGESWQPDRPKTADLGDKQRVFWQVNQGQVMWSEYHQCFLFVYCDNFWSCQVLVSPHRR